MANSTITVRIDNGIKEQAEILFDSIGINTTTAITMFLKAAIRENKIPFELKGSSDPFYSEENMRHLRAALKRYENHNIVQHELIEEDND